MQSQSIVLLGLFYFTGSTDRLVYFIPVKTQINNLYRLFHSWEVSFMQSRSIVLLGLFYSTGRFDSCSRNVLFYWVCSILLGDFIHAVAIYCSTLLGGFIHAVAIYCSILLGGLIHAVTIYCCIECFQLLIPLSGSNFLILNESRVSSAAIASKQKSLISRLL